MIIAADRNTRLLPNTGNILVRFYRGEKVHPSGYSIDDVWKFSSDQLERTHGYIQWIFPLQRPSAHVHDVPVLNKDEIAEFRTDDSLRSRVLRSLGLMLDFYGFQLDEDKVTPSTDFRRKGGWLYVNNHNYLRIGRILESLMLLEFRSEAEAFLDALMGIYDDFRWEIGESIRIWKRTVGRLR